MVDTLDEGSGFARHLVTRDVDSVDVPLSGLAAAASEADLVLLDVLAGGPEEVLAVAGSHAAAAVAQSAGKPVWAVVGVGRLLPARMWDALVDRVTRPADPWDLDEERLPVALVDRVVGVRASSRSRTPCAASTAPSRPSCSARSEPASDRFTNTRSGLVR